MRLKYSHHEKTVVVDDRVAFVGGIDLTLDGGDPFDSPKHPSHGHPGWHDVAVRIEGPAVADVAEHFRLRWHGASDEWLPEPPEQEPCGDVELQVVRTIPEGVFGALPRRRLQRLRVVLPRAPLGGAARLPREPVPLVTGDRLDPRRQAAQPTVRRLSGRRRPPRSTERRRGRVEGGSCRPDRGGRREQRDSSPARSRPRGPAPRPRLRPREGRHRRRSLAHDRIGEPQRAFDVQRLRGERRVARREAGARARLELWRSISRHEDIDGDSTRVVDELWAADRRASRSSGSSGGAAFPSARDAARGLPSPRRIVGASPGTGLRRLSTGAMRRRQAVHVVRIRLRGLRHARPYGLELGGDRRAVEDRDRGEERPELRARRSRPAARTSRRTTSSR